MAVTIGPFSLDRMVRAVEKVRERLLRATAALEKAGTFMSLSMPNTSRTTTSRSGAAMTVPESPYLGLISFIARAC